jgi:O-antigen/teichoic acid export membrane protein
LLLNTVFASVSYIQGQKFHENKEEYKIIHDTLNIVFIAAMTVLVSVSEMLAIPFVKLYTRDVYDVNYIYPILPILFGYVQILSWCRIITGNLTGIAGYAKKVSRISMVEAISNVVLSLILVNSFGIVGVLFATVISLPLKIVYCAYVSDKKILERSFLKTFKIFLSNIVLYTVIVYFSVNFTLSINSYLEFILKGAVVFVICSLVVGLVNMVMNINNIKQALILMRK